MFKRLRLLCTLPLIQAVQRRTHSKCKYGNKNQNPEKQKKKKEKKGILRDSIRTFKESVGLDCHDKQHKYKSISQWKIKWKVKDTLKMYQKNGNRHNMFLITVNLETSAEILHQFYSKATNPAVATLFFDGKWYFTDFILNVIGNIWQSTLIIVILVISKFYQNKLWSLNVCYGDSLNCFLKVFMPFNF